MHAHLTFTSWADFNSSGLRSCSPSGATRHLLKCRPLWRPKKLAAFRRVLPLITPSPQARAIELGEAPSPLTKREGKLLRLVFPEEARLGPARTTQVLQARCAAAPSRRHPSPFGLLPGQAASSLCAVPSLLQDALVGKERIGRLMLLGVWARQAAGKEPERCLLYAARALAYLQAGNAAQALEVRLKHAFRRSRAWSRR